MTKKRMVFMRELLNFIGIGDRLHLEWISSAEAQKFTRVVSDFTEKIKELGPNPLHGRAIKLPENLFATPPGASRPANPESPLSATKSAEG